MPHDHFYTNEKVKFKTESTSALYKSISANSLTANGYDKETMHNNNFVLEKKNQYEASNNRGWKEDFTSSSYF